jgi:hypothetical protein
MRERERERERGRESIFSSLAFRIIIFISTFPKIGGKIDHLTSSTTPLALVLAGVSCLYCSKKIRG